ncbi:MULTISPECIES: dihydroxyacetone kinase subunit DhaL [Caproicibacterium]|jgi:dihydroxyacetone kinase-like protein|uniref:phosphoenolpyruvate--glycerone phosphotransferase n=1 Tax=Caproicibacterium lactatifermentans TaxID=2666138 RepID=A0A859DW08_9FIRM|nr:dihydroxyacetone kinase subunit DhaL [Caproicibacterium lactatifermentans]ARP49788.1 dihydroxyacetone kinase subunit L [Ruminococcaceae bacterium CPB6]MDD4808358.1 dihydroxyacetone kinase subunit DhaL [Oscillospiraceae bacterium]QKN24483.1 dihydroxyacetone kinase subunit L [Caproicibacterium lactatifermentans]QKO31196.1 dihydroxyacetone kinase subunit L [Caproicibacterium lactatifermentans]
MTDSKTVLKVISAVSTKIKEKEDYLTELDKPIGDSDHGINMARGFTAVDAKLPLLEDKDIGTILKTVGMTLVSTVGGASGPLYGTAFMRAGMAVGSKTEISTDDFLNLMDAAAAGVKQRGHAEPEDATMLDAIIPALDAMKKAAEAGKTPKEMLTLGTAAAKKGAAHTAGLVAKKGRASYLGERGIGHIDPGAASFALMVEAATETIV